MKKYKCQVCGYIIELDHEPNENCPVCDADPSEYVEIIEE